MEAASQQRDLGDLRDTETALSLSAEHTGARWLDAKWGKRRGHARRHRCQPFPWTCVYEFVPEEGEACLVSGEVLHLGVTRPGRREQEVGKRKGPVFHAMSNGRRGVGRVVPGCLTSFARWHFLGDDAVMRTMPDTEIEIFQSWGESTAFNTWKGRVQEEARKTKRRAALRRRPAPPPLDTDT
jgi:hypothetical protein